jgi:hypothetical protein
MDFMRATIRKLLRWAVPVMLVMSADRAAADIIDGNWCHADGRTFSIQGPELVTPRGHRITGNYSRHYFSYTVPDSEPAAGAKILMTLWNENTVHVQTETTGSGSGKEEIWNRCGPSVSRFEAPFVTARR